MSFTPDTLKPTQVHIHIYKLTTPEITNHTLLAHADTKNTHYYQSQIKHTQVCINHKLNSQTDTQITD